MFWDKKHKKQGLPDLPDLPSRKIQLPPIKPSVSIPENNTPKLNPNSPINSAPKNFLPNRNKIQEKTQLPKLPEFREHKEETILELNPEEHDLDVIPSQIHPKIKINQQEKGPIYIRLDKYKSAKDSLENIKEKLEEVDLLLKKTREIRTKEESELGYWEKETSELKLQIERVTENIFDKTE